MWYDSSRLKKVFQQRDAMIGKSYASVAQSVEQLIRNYQTERKQSNTLMWLNGRASHS